MTQTPQGFARSLKDRAANASKAAGIPANELVERYYHGRLLARVFHLDHDGWVLKGGQALLARWPQARYSTDVDLLRTEDRAGIEDAVKALVAIAAAELDDHLRFDHYDTSQETTADRPTRKVRFKVMFGLKQLAMVSVDVVASDQRPLGELVVEQLAAPFTIDSHPWPEIRMWPLEDHVADKIAAMYERHRAARIPSTRYKDLVDLVLIALKSSLPGPLTHAALHAEVARRRRAGTHLALPAAFEVPDRSWNSGYRAQAKTAHDLPAEYLTLEGASPLADRFVSPLLREAPPTGRWSPENLTWS
jgi:predicted nucleotidyltransferase component of viral defense system